MNRVTSSLTSIVLLIHAALGCCWHHAHAGHPHGGHSHGGHAESARCTPQRYAESFAANSPSNHCCPNTQQPHDGPRERPHQPCDADACRFTRPENSNWGGMLADWTTTVLAVDRLASVEPRRSSGYSLVDGAAAPAPPLARHLLHCALLI